MGARLIRWVQITLSVGILASLVYVLDFSSFTDFHVNFSQKHITLILVLLIMALWIRSFRWQMLMNQAPDVNVGGLDSFRFLLVGSALNMILPAGSGDIAKSYFGFRWSGIKERMLSISLLDKFIAIGSLAFLCVGSIYITGETYFIWAMLLSTFPLVLVMNEKRFRKVKIFENIFQFVNRKVRKVDLEEVLKNMNISNKYLAFSLLLSCVGWIMSYMVLYYCFHLVAAEISFNYVLAMGPLLTLARLFPFTFNGIGSDEVVIVFLFSQGGQAQETILMAALIYRIIMLIIPAIPGLYFLAVTKKMGSTQDSTTED